MHFLNDPVFPINETAPPYDRYESVWAVLLIKEHWINEPSEFEKKTPPPNVRYNEIEDPLNTVLLVKVHFSNDWLDSNR